MCRPASPGNFVPDILVNILKQQKEYIMKTTLCNWIPIGLVVLAICLGTTEEINAQWAIPGANPFLTHNPEIQKADARLILDNFNGTGTAGLRFQDNGVNDALFGFNLTADQFEMDNDLDVDGRLRIEGTSAINLAGPTVLEWGENGTGVINHFPSRVGIGTTSIGATTDLGIDGGADTKLTLMATSENKIEFDQGANTGFMRMIGSLMELRNDNGDFEFTKSNTGDPHMIIKNDGKVGIGTDAPGSQLEVDGNTKVLFNSSGSNGTLELVETEDDDFTRFYFRNSQDLGLRWSLAGRLGSTLDHIFGLYYDGDPRLTYNEPNSEFTFDGVLDIASNFNTALRVDGKQAIWWEPTDNRISWGFDSDYNYFADEVRIGGAGAGAPNYQLEVVGDADITGELTAASDLRLKENIVDLPTAVEKVKELRPVYYDFKTDEFNDLNLSEKTRMGFIAQEVEQVFPELISEGKEQVQSNGDTFNVKSVNYMDLIPVLTKAIQEQQEQIQALKNQIEMLKD